MSVPFFVWMHAEVYLLQAPVEGFGERDDRGLVERREGAHLDRAQLAPLSTQLVEHRGGILEEPPAEAFVGRQSTDDHFHASMGHARPECESRAARLGAGGNPENDRRITVLRIQSRGAKRRAGL